MAVQFRDYYETLGVDRGATQDEIRKSFRKLARKHHPDVAADKKNAEAKFKEINEAYEVLGNPESRTKYDELGAGWQSGQEFRPPQGWGHPGAGQADEFHFGGTGFSDFFEQFFGSGGAEGFGVPRGGTGRRQPRARPGRDVEADLLVGLEEIVKGSTRTITLSDNAGGPPSRIHVKIPAGIPDGGRIRLAGKGGVGSGGAAAGDLFLRVRYARHPDFRVEGTNLICELTLPAWDAVLGAKVSVPTLGGHVSLKIPPGTQSGTRMRLRGQGLALREQAPGDLIVEIQISAPSAADEKERAMWEKLRDLHGAR